MKVAAFIPARGGSKRVTSKNLSLVGERTLVRRAINAAFACAGGESIWVSTDDEAIAIEARAFGAMVHERPAALATDHAQIESAISHWFRRLDEKPDVIVMLQPTSPFRTARHVAEALKLLADDEIDSVIGVTAGHEPHFAGRMKPRETYSSLCGGDQCCPSAMTWWEWQPFSPIAKAGDRPRTQDLPPRGHDNGALYATRRSAWEASELRVSGTVAALPFSKIEGWDIDTVEDIELARAWAERTGT